MIEAKITELKDFILSKNTYFDKGYHNVYKDETTGIVADGVTLFPTDNQGNIFYLRQPNDIRITQDIPTQEGVPGIAVNADLILVAYALGDVDKLAKNLIWTLQAFGKDEIAFTSISINAPTVIISELSGLPEETRLTALKNFDNRHALCSIAFTYRTPFIFQSTNCITEPCPDC